MTIRLLKCRVYAYTSVLVIRVFVTDRLSRARRLLFCYIALLLAPCLYNALQGSEGSRFSRDD